MIKKLQRSLCFASVIFLAALGSAWAQRQPVSGKITDATGQPMPGVNILLKGTTVGTTTDVGGGFSLEASANDILVISFIGYKTREVSVGNQSTLNVELEEDVDVLNEVVVIGYGEVRKSDLTGAVAQISEKQLRGSIVTNIDQALQGRVPGVQVTQNSGAPGGALSVRIRGASSINGSSEPLYVVDGIPFEGEGTEIQGFDWAGGSNGQNRVNPLSTINPNDIVSIEVLKDASATAIYGSRAANGVVLISTRRGKKGESRISYNTYYALQTPQKKLDMMNLPQFADYQGQIGRELGQPVPLQYLDPTLLNNGTDWQDEIFRTAGMQSHQLSVNGGSDKTQYAVSGGYLAQDGTIIGTNFKRFTTRINLDNQVKDWFKVGTSLTYANTTETIALTDGSDGVLSQSLMVSPDIPVRDLDGNFAGPSNNFSGVSTNPVASAQLRNNDFDRQRIMANFYGDVQLIRGLTFRSEIGIDNNRGFNKAFLPTYQWGALVNNQNQLFQREEQSFFWIWKNFLTYNLKTGDHSINALAGTEAQKSKWEGFTVHKKNFASNDIPVLSQGDNATNVTNGWKDASTLSSYFGRVNYGFKDRYLLTATLRADGSSKFGPQNRWGYYPSAALAWRISNESFMKGVTPVSNLKLRLGYGEVGNQAIDTYLYGSSLKALISPFGTAYKPEKISNPALQWETTTQYNIGLDLGLFQGRIDLTADVYQKYIDKMLLQQVVPSILGGPKDTDIEAPYANIGKMENKGIDIGLTTHNIVSNKLDWTTSFNLSLNRNRVSSIDRPYTQALYWYSEFQSATRTVAGQPMGQFYGYVVDGIFKDQQDILGHAVQIQDKGTATPVNLVNRRDGVWIGDLKFKDLNDDGVIDAQDQTYIGNPNPKFTFGLNNSFTYGPFDVNIFLTGSYGAKILNYSRVQIEGMNNLYANQAATVNNRARYQLLNPEGSDTDPANVVLANPDTDMPRFATNDNNRNNRMSTRFIEDGSYLRLQNVSIAYTVPATLTSRFRIERLRIYANAQNIYRWTNYSGYDPEIGAHNQSPLFQNVDMGRYPTPKTFTLGLDIDF